MPNGAKCWCFTINNPTEEDASAEDILGGKDGILRPENERPPAHYCKAKYAIWQFEVGDSGTFHIQGYVEWDRRHTLEHVTRLFGRRGHWEIRRESACKARDYCKKEEGRFGERWWEIGNWEDHSYSGKRTDLLEIKEKLDAGVSQKVIAKEHFGSWLRNYKGLIAYVDLNSAKRDAKSHVTVVVGETGLGKSTWLREQAPEAYWVSPPKGAEGIWWDGYEGEKDVIFDDFSDWVPYRTLLRWMDQFPLRVQFKGGSKEFAPERLWFSSNKHPRNWFETEDYPPLARRIDVLHEFIGRGDWGLSGAELTGGEPRELANGILDWDVRHVLEDPKERGVMKTKYQGLVE